MTPALAARMVVFTGAGGPEVIGIEEREVAAPGPGQVRVTVEAAGLNRADVLQRRGLYPAPRGTVSDVPGLEYAGQVEALGAGVSGLEVGQRVMGLVPGGAMSEQLLVPAAEVLAVPAGLETPLAAAVPEAFLTVWDALVDQGGLRPGDRVLVHAVGSGIGTAALQLGGALGARVLGTSRSNWKLERCRRDLGLEHALHVTEGRFADQVMQLTDGRGVDLVLDTVGAAYLEQNMACLARGGRLLALGLLGGTRATLDMGALVARRARLLGTVLRSRPAHQKARLAAHAREHLLPLLASGQLRPVVDEVLPMAELARAHGRLEAGDVLGKLVLRWS